MFENSVRGQKVLVQYSSIDGTLELPQDKKTRFPYRLENTKHLRQWHKKSMGPQKKV